MSQGVSAFPVHLEIVYPDRPLDRLSTALRAFYAIPITVVLGLLGSFGSNSGGGGGGLLVAGPGVMILFRRKYPRWWFDWNLEYMRFSNRVLAYWLLLTDTYPATDEAQGVALSAPYPDASRDLNRWLPLVKWLLALPHYFILAVLTAAAAVAVLIAWIAIVIGGRYPPGLFDFVVGVLRWWNRVLAYAFWLATDEYPPFRLAA